MYDNWLSIEFDKWGFTIDAAPFYLSITWGLLIVVGAAVVAYKVWKNYR